MGRTRRGLSVPVLRCEQMSTIPLPYGLRRLWWALAFATLIASTTSAAEQTVILDDPYTRSADGITAYLGVIPASVVRGHAPTHPESTMHGGEPRAAYERHVLVALFDTASSNRIRTADVTATVEGRGHIGRVTKKLEPMEIAGAMTFGQFFSMPESNVYTIKVDIVVAGRPEPVSIAFKYRT